ncbi:MAG: DUF1254 domain-containing protein [Phycisphaerales bacterium]
MPRPNGPLAILTPLPAAFARAIVAGAAAAAFAIGTAGAAAPPPATPADDVTAAKPAFARGELAALAEEAMIYGLPIVMNYGVMYESFVDSSSTQYKGPFNQMFNNARVYTPKDTAVVTPNSDTPYSFFCADLRAEPVVFTVPPIEKERYFSVQLVDWYTFNMGYVGSRTTGNGGGSYMIAGPSWKGEAPKGVAKVFRCETDFVFAIYRTQLFNPADIDNVRRIQAGYTFQPLSSFAHTPAPAAPPAVTWPRIDKASGEKDPFAYLAFVLQFCPPVGPAEVEKPFRAKLAAMGIVPGKPFTPERFTPEQRTELEAGAKAAMAKVKARAAALGKEENGWRVGAAFGDRAFYKGDWLLRAAAAAAGIYGNDAEEALYPILATTRDGKKPDCTTNRYVLTLPAGQLPPANAFWSVTMYDAATQLLVANPLDRYLINSPMLPSLKKNADGSISLYIQHDSPGKDRESNWLPAPAGPIYVVMRLYWPKPAAIDGSWKPPFVELAK